MVPLPLYNRIPKNANRSSGGAAGPAPANERRARPSRTLFDRSWRTEFLPAEGSPHAAPTIMAISALDLLGRLEAEGFSVARGR
jgi:hypothetical protein